MFIQFSLSLPVAGSGDDLSVGDVSLPVSGELEGEVDEEDAWLDALESGNVDDTGYLPQKRDPKLLTTRQVSQEEASSSASVLRTLCCCTLYNWGKPEWVPHWQEA